MKLRLRGDSLRLRLTQLEVAVLRNQNWWQDASTLGPDGGPRFVYRVESADVAKPAVSFTPGIETSWFKLGKAAKYDDTMKAVAFVGP